MKLLLALSLLISIFANVVSAQPLTTKFAYDALDRLTNVVFQDATCARYAYDAVGRLTNLVHSDGAVISYTYDPNGNRLSERVAEVVDGVSTNRLTSHTYDKINRVETTSYWNGTVVRYTYSGREVSRKVEKSSSGDVTNLWVTPKQAEEAMTKIRPTVLNHPESMVRETLLDWIKTGRVQFAANNILPGVSSSLEQDGDTTKVLLWYNTKFVASTDEKHLGELLLREAYRIQSYLFFVELSPKKRR